MSHLTDPPKRNTRASATSQSLSKKKSELTSSGSITPIVLNYHSTRSFLHLRCGALCPFCSEVKKIFYYSNIRWLDWACLTTWVQTFFQNKKDEGLSSKMSKWSCTMLKIWLVLCWPMMWVHFFSTQNLVCSSDVRAAGASKRLRNFWKKGRTRTVLRSQGGAR